jgi:UDP:flavonoid glycosyltransferase YjiC (YdhE family)
MTRYLAYTSPARGHLYPIVPTLLELRDRGHEVHVRTLASEVGALQAEGIEAQPMAAEIEQAPLDDWEGATPEEGLARALATFARRAAHEVEDLKQAIAQADPDVLLIDITTVGAAAVAEASAIPLFQHFSFGPEAPQELTFVPFAIAPEPGLEVLNAPRREVGLAPLSDPDQVWRASLHLYYTAEPFQPRGMRLPATFRLIGPGVWEPPSQPPDWLKDTEGPLVLVSASSERQRDDLLIQTALEALAGQEVTVVVSSAAHDPGRFRAPANAHLERWLPHHHMIKKAACVGCHGGMGITQKALAAGVPVCVVPFGRDQTEVAKRLSACEAGAVITPGALNPASLRAAVHGAIEKRAGAQQLAAAFKHAGGANAACDALQSLLNLKRQGRERDPQGDRIPA